MDLGDFDGEQGYFEAKNSAGDKEFDENETQTSDIEYWERGTRM